jgi:hypothetical protein
MGNPVDVNDAFLFSEEAGENVGTAAADEAFDFEESFLAGDVEAGSGEGLFEGRLGYLGGIEFDGDGLWSDLKDLGSLNPINNGLDLRRDILLAQSACEQNETLFGGEASA